MRKCVKRCKHTLTHKCSVRFKKNVQTLFYKKLFSVLRISLKQCDAYKITPVCYVERLLKATSLFIGLLLSLILNGTVMFRDSYATRILKQVELNNSSFNLSAFSRFSAMKVKLSSFFIRRVLDIFLRQIFNLQLKIFFLIIKRQFYVLTFFSFQKKK